MSITKNLDVVARTLQEQLFLLSTRVTLLEKANEKNHAKVEELEGQLTAVENQLSEVKQIAMSQSRHDPCA